ncbi:hypothetical protein GQR58_027663 [Nymphon striatum]|nr:hypothetical protein GQR58_027663 [Nymphon striatum]
MQYFYCNTWNSLFYIRFDNYKSLMFNYFSTKSFFSLAIILTFIIIIAFHFLKYICQFGWDYIPCAPFRFDLAVTLHPAMIVFVLLYMLYVNSSRPWYSSLGILQVVPNSLLRLPEPVSNRIRMLKLDATTRVSVSSWSDSRVRISDFSTVFPSDVKRYAFPSHMAITSFFCNFLLHSGLLQILRSKGDQLLFIVIVAQEFFPILWSSCEQLDFREIKSSKTSELSTDWSLCIFCQKSNNAKLVCPADSKSNNTGVDADIGKVLSDAFDTNNDRDAMCLARTAQIIRTDMFQELFSFNGSFSSKCQEKSLSLVLIAMVSMLLEGPNILKQTAHPYIGANSSRSTGTS